MFRPFITVLVGSLALALPACGEPNDDPTTVSVYVTLENQDELPAHLYVSGEEAGPQNKVEPGQSRDQRFECKVGTDEEISFEITALRNGDVLGTASFSEPCIKSSEGTWVYVWYLDKWTGFRR